MAYLWKNRLPFIKLDVAGDMSIQQKVKGCSILGVEREVDCLRAGKSCTSLRIGMNRTSWRGEAIQSPLGRREETCFDIIGAIAQTLHVWNIRMPTIIRLNHLKPPQGVGNGKSSMLFHMECPVFRIDRSSEFLRIDQTTSPPQ